ncbi:MAG: trigger factor [Hyphomonadaceae bacterium]|nr:MAG: trigger factor [Hyphomonadaceae bacterium]
MNIAEKLKDGLNRIYTITVTASELAVTLEEKIQSLAPTMNIKGFRKGKVPVSHVRRTYGKSIMAEMLNDIVQEGVDKSYALNNVRPASNPEIADFGNIDAVIEGKADLVFDVSMDILPDFEIVSLETLEIKRPIASASDDEVQTALAEIAKQSQAFETKKGKAKAGDQVICNFLGKLNGVEFEGGRGEGASIVIGSNTFIPGFEDALVGVKAGDETIINVTFPAEYAVKELAGKPATFGIEVMDVQSPVETKIDDALATRIGLSDLASLKEAVKTDIERQFGEISRQKAKRSLLDALDSAYSFDLPAKMVAAEFDSIWAQIEADKKQGNVDPDDEGKSDEDLKAEYTKIAERRVRLGLVLAEIGRVGEVTISDEELGQALIREASRYPGQERQVYDFFQKNQQMMAQLRAPLYEEKVVDHILQKAKVSDFAVTRAELESDDDEVVAEAKPVKKPAKAAPKAKKADAADEAVAAPAKTTKPKKETKK